MPKKMTYILSVAGHDPSGGAGILADIKVFEHHRLLGFGAVTSITYQNEISFEGIHWLTFDEIIRQIKPLSKHPLEVAKIGLIKDLIQLNELIDQLLYLFPGIKIVWDPILKASTGFEFHSTLDSNLLKDIFNKIFLITPNVLEAAKLGAGTAIENSMAISNSCYVLLKGGHIEEHSNDQLYFKGDLLKFFDQVKLYGVEKHGSGCVLSSAIASNLALGKTIENACREGKEYTKDFLISNETLLGQHPNTLIA
jgi:hydroxymethylpyrimidine/phosphomethylpyrimidine kinase